MLFISVPVVHPFPCGSRLSLTGWHKFKGLEGNDEDQDQSATVQTSMFCRLVHCSGGYIVPPREVPNLVSRCHPDSEISGLTLINLNPFKKCTVVWVTGNSRTLEHTSYIWCYFLSLHRSCSDCRRMRNWGKITLIRLRTCSFARNLRHIFRGNWGIYWHQNLSTSRDIVMTPIKRIHSQGFTIFSQLYRYK